MNPYLLHERNIKILTYLPQVLQEGSELPVGGRRIDNQLPADGRAQGPCLPPPDLGKAVKDAVVTANNYLVKRYLVVYLIFHRVACFEFYLFILGLEYCP